MERQLATLATDTGTTFAKLFQVEGIQTILFKFWAFRVYTLNNLTPIRLFYVKGRFSGLSAGIEFKKLTKVNLKIKQNFLSSLLWPNKFNFKF